MAQVKLETTLTITDTDSAVKPIVTTNTTSYTSYEEKEYVIAATTNKVVWDTATATTDSTETASDFDFLYIKSSGNCDVELVTDVDGDVGNEAGTVRVVSGIPLVLGADDSYANVTGVDALAGTLDVIDYIRVRNPGTASITVRVILAS